MLRYEVTDENNTKQSNTRNQRDFLTDSIYLHAKVSPLKNCLGQELT